MPVVELRRGDDKWLLQVGDEHETKEQITNKALAVANGSGEGREAIMPGNGEPGWKVVHIHPDEQFLELYGVTDEQVHPIPTRPDKRLNS